MKIDTVKVFEYLFKFYIYNHDSLLDKKWDYSTLKRKGRLSILRETSFVKFVR